MACDSPMSRKTQSAAHCAYTLLTPPTAELLLFRMKEVEGGGMGGARVVQHVLSASSARVPLAA